MEWGVKDELNAGGDHQGGARGVMHTMIMASTKRNTKTLSNISDGTIFKYS